MEPALPGKINPPRTLQRPCASSLSKGARLSGGVLSPDSRRKGGYGLKFIATVVATGFAAMLLVGSVYGGPQNGIGLYGGAVWHSFFLPGTPRDFDFTSAGVSVAADAQFVWNEHLSINPALLFSLEDIREGNREGEVASYSSTLQVRFWRGNGYIGGHIGIYRETIRTARQTLQTGDAGFGAAAGWERDDGLIFNLQYDWERAVTSETIQALRAHIGFRWH